MTTRRAYLLLFLFPLFAQAQEHQIPRTDRAYFGAAIFENPQDSADYTQFVNGLQRVDAALNTDTTTYQFRMAWKENQHGGITLVTRGDGSKRKSSARIEISEFELTSVPYRTADGRRVMMLIHEVPCGLICRTTYYYVEE